MKFTLAWLKDHLETQADAAAIGEKLTALGLEVESIEDKAKTLAPFTVAEVLGAAPHPNADKLKVCQVDTGKEKLQVVCGAPNARAGLKVVFAAVGTTIPTSGMTLTAATIRGVASNGMLCSAREMGISDDHEGIIELPADAPVGVPFAEVLALNDPVIDIAITPNRGDCLAVRGVARDLAAGGLGTLKPGEVPAVAGNFPSPIKIALELHGDAQSACPVFAGRVVRGLKNGPSPDWLKQRLEAVGLRSINALVDVTNFISLDRARPLHVYDASKITGTIRARLGRSGETLAALDGREYAVDDTMCVIADDAGVLGLGGVMGGSPSGSTLETTDVFIESATFDPIRTAQTGRKTGILSDARYRFERGVDPAFVLPGLELATAMILELCGGEASAIEVAGAPPLRNLVLTFDPQDVARLTGLDLKPGRIAEILDALGFGMTPAGAGFSVAVPSWRPDVHGPADLVEEVMRVHGLDHVPSTPLPVRALSGAMLSTRQKRVRLARRALAARGLTEAVTYSFLPAAHAEVFGAKPPVKLANPISADLDAMRPSPLPALVTAAQRNADRAMGDCALFEVGPAFSVSTPGNQQVVAAGVRRGFSRPRHWSGKAKPADVFDAKADAVALLAALGAPVDSLQIGTDAPAWYHPGRSGTLKLGPKTVLAQFGELHPSALEAMDAKGPHAAFEVFLAAIPEPKAKPTRNKGALALADLNPLERDFAFVVDAGVQAADLVRAARAADKALIVAADVFDVFEGGNLGDGKKSVAISVKLQPTDKTLTDAEIDEVSQKVIASVVKATGGILRS